jgi:hypothetical protein
MVTAMPDVADKSSPPAPSADAARIFARVRWMMIIAGLTTAVAVAAVFGVIGYRVYSRSGGGAATITSGTVFLPQGAHVVSTTISDGQIVVTLDVAGVNEVRIFDLKTLQMVGQLRFATAH